MSLDPTQVRVAANGKVYVAPKGTAGPTDATTALAADFVDLGYVSEDGATLSRSTDSETVMSWQSTAPLRYIITGAELSAQFALLQFNPDTLPLYFGGGTVAPVDGQTNVFRFDISAAADIDERCFVIETNDGAITYRYVFPRAQVSETDDLPLSRTEASQLPMTISTLASADGTLGYVITNDPAFNVGTGTAEPTGADEGSKSTDATVKVKA